MATAAILRAMATADDVLEFWFGNTQGAAPPPEQRKTWWIKSDEHDATIRDRFGDLHAAMASGTHADWLDTPRACLARIIVLDQFSRNLFRNRPEAFAQDGAAIAATDVALGRGDLDVLGPFEQLFVLMPLMHSEVPARQEQCIAEFTALCQRAPAEEPKVFDSNLDFAHRHKAIIDRFGRYPHRNEVLGRTSSEDERVFLNQPGSSF